ncbi:MAG: helix-turn-helix transcriptional regulator [Anaerolineales bacterium]|nr:helix-turn-helix transcriptional regulator [Anaerolineales bacterium]
MNFVFDERPSDAPFVEKIWRTRSERSGSFISAAASQWEMVVTRYQGKTTFTVRGPETKASPADYPADTEFFGIIFKLGAFMPHLPLIKLLDRNDATLPEASSQSFWLHGSAWQFPDYENADTFVTRLVRKELLVQEPVVEAVLQNRPLELSLRSVQRRFLHATGLTRGTLDQIERAHQAMALLEQGGSIADAVYQAGYADQPHLTRSLKHFIGQTPAQILRTVKSA